jgi:hypothetical protein
MGLIARHRERRQKLAHARKRAAELLPLCEQATGVTLGKPLKIEASKPWKHKLRYFRHAVSTLFFGSKDSNLQDGFVPGRIMAFRLQMALRKLACPGNYEEKLFGYSYLDLGVVGVNLNCYSPGAAASDYVLAHELVHLLLSKVRAFDTVARAAPGIVLYEGAATFYGARIANGLHPEFDVSAHRSFKGEYKQGHELFSAVSSSLGDPATTIGAYPPRLDVLECVNAKSIASYIEMVRAIQSSGRTSIEFFGYPRGIRRSRLNEEHMTTHVQPAELHQVQTRF